MLLRVGFQTVEDSMLHGLRQLASYNRRPMGTIILMPVPFRFKTLVLIYRRRRMKRARLQSTLD